MDSIKKFREDIKVYIAQTLLRLEDIELSDIQTRQLLEKNSIDKNIDEVDTIVIGNLINTLKFIDELDLTKTTIDSTFYIKLNSILTVNQALEIGKYRDKDGFIGCIQEAIKPPKQEDIEDILSQLSQISRDDFADVVAFSFCKLSKMQPFFDGNKRTTLFVCNIAMIQKGLGYFSIPNEKYVEFENYLREYYVNNDKALYNFIKDTLIVSNLE